MGDIRMIFNIGRLLFFIGIQQVVRIDVRSRDQGPLRWIAGIESPEIGLRRHMLPGRSILSNYGRGCGLRIGGAVFGRLLVAIVGSGAGSGAKAQQQNQQGQGFPGRPGPDTEVVENIQGLLI
ncbi:MAG: hypothetical protein KDK34_22855, partial [Leptospiraceae bacterium]|nr:hypothetical protein [Leptospiraceae bacterium]